MRRHEACIIARPSVLLQTVATAWNIFDLVWHQATPADFITLPQIPWYIACGSKPTDPTLWLAVSKLYRLTPARKGARDTRRLNGLDPSDVRTTQRHIEH